MASHSIQNKSTNIVQGNRFSEEQWERMVKERDQENRWLRQELQKTQQMYHQLLALYHGSQPVINQSNPQTPQNLASSRRNQSSSDQGMDASSTDPFNICEYKGPKEPKQVVEIQRQAKETHILRTVSQIKSQQFLANQDINQHEIEVNLSEINSTDRLYIRVDLVGKLGEERRRHVKHLRNVEVPIIRHTPTTIVTIPNMKIEESSHNHGKALFYQYTLMSEPENFFTTLSAIESEQFTTITPKKPMIEKTSKIQFINQTWSRVFACNAILQNHPTRCSNHHQSS